MDYIYLEFKLWFFQKLEKNFKIYLEHIWITILEIDNEEGYGRRNFWREWLDMCLSIY